VALPVRGVEIIRLPEFSDLRGSIAIAEAAEVIPFDVKRIYFIFGVPSSEVRGEHAHRECHQLLLAAHGSCAVIVDDGQTRVESVLDSPRLALYVPPMIWAVQHKYSNDAVLAVIASMPYDPADYIRDYAEFRRLALETER
jgi:hypothetical protein